MLFCHSHTGLQCATMFSISVLDLGSHSILPLYSLWYTCEPCSHRSITNHSTSKIFSIQLAPQKGLTDYKVQVTYVLVTLGNAWERYESTDEKAGMVIKVKLHRCPSTKEAGKGEREGGKDGKRKKNKEGSKEEENRMSGRKGAKKKAWGREMEMFYNTYFK